MEIIKTKSFELAAILKGNKNAKRIAIALPGRLDTKDYANFNSHLKLLASKGLLAVSFDPPGTWESPGGIELFTTTNYIKAVNELIDYFGNRPTLLLGHSRGGAVATLAGTNNPSVIALVTINESLGKPSPPDAETLRTGIYRDHRDMPPGTKRTSQQKNFEMSLTYFKDGAKYNDAEVLKSCTRPKLMFYGVNDEFNSPDFIKGVFNSVPQPKELYELKCTHDYRLYPEAVKEVNEKLSEFVKKYI